MSAAAASEVQLHLVSEGLETSITFPPTDLQVTTLRPASPTASVCSTTLELQLATLAAVTPSAGTVAEAAAVAHINTAVYLICCSSFMGLSFRVLIVDWDVHHGQGLQYLFQEDPR